MKTFEPNLKSIADNENYNGVEMTVEDVRDLIDRLCEDPADYEEFIEVLDKAQGDAKTTEEDEYIIIKIKGV